MARAIMNPVSLSLTITTIITAAAATDLARSLRLSHWHSEAGPGRMSVGTRRVKLTPARRAPGHPAAGPTRRLSQSSEAKTGRDEPSLRFACSFRTRNSRIEDSGSSGLPES